MIRLPLKSKTRGAPTASRATSIITGASASRQAVAALFAFAYQDSGYEKTLMDGVLDAPERMPAGAHRSEECTARRNAARPQLVGREIFAINHTNEGVRHA